MSPPRENYSEDEMDGLTESERQAIADINKDDGEELGGEQEEIGAATTEPQDSDKPAAATTADPPATADPAAAAAAAAAEPVAQAEPAPTVTDRAAIPNWQAPADASAKLAAISDEKAALVQKLDDGEISAGEYAKQLDRLQDEKEAITKSQLKAEIAGDMTVAWWSDRTVPAFLAAHPEYGQNPELERMLDTHVRREQEAAMSAGKNAFDPGILDAAHKKVDDFLASVGARRGAAPSPTPVPTPTPTPRPAGLGERPAPPPTLAHIPATDPAGIDNNEFAVLERMDGLAFEEAFARLTPEQRTRYQMRQD